MAFAIISPEPRDDARDQFDTLKGEIKMSSDISEKLPDAATGEDKPIGRKHPSAPAAIVMMAYPALLIVGLLAVFALLAFTS